MWVELVNSFCLMVDELQRRITSYNVCYTKLLRNLTQLNGSWVKENYHLLNTGIDYRVNHWVQFFLKADNLLNASYEMNAGYPMPGIMGFVGINVNL